MDYNLTLFKGSVEEILHSNQNSAQNNLSLEIVN